MWTHLALAERLLHPLLTFPALLVPPLLDSLNPLIQQRLLPPRLNFCLPLRLASKTPPRRVSRVDEVVGGLSKLTRTVEVDGEGEGRGEEGSGENPVLGELYREAKG